MARTQLSINLKEEAVAYWNAIKDRGGASHTKMALAGLLAFAGLSRDEQGIVMSKAAAFDEDRAKWDVALSAVQYLAERREALGEELVRLRRKQKDAPRPAKR